LFRDLGLKGWATRQGAHNAKLFFPAESRDPELPLDN
jgi:hypothetical protein